MKHLSYAALILSAGALFAQDAKTGPSSTIVVSGDKKPKGLALNAERIKVPGLMMPESVAARKGKLYIANVGGAPMKSPKQGFFIIADLNGANSKVLFKGMLDDPKGFGFFDDNTVIISDHPSVKVLDIKNEKILAEIAVPKAGFLNDIVVLDKNNALLSDSGTGTVHLLTYKGGKLTLSPIKGLQGTVSGVNGLDFANNKLYLVTSTLGGNPKEGNIYTFTFTKGWTEGTLSKPWFDKQFGGGALDGIHFTNGHLLVSDWGKGGTKTSAAIYAVNEAEKKIAYGTGGRSSIADFGFSEDEWIYFPEMLENSIIKIHNPVAK